MTRHTESSDHSFPRARHAAAVPASFAPWFAAAWVFPVLAACAVVLTGHVLGVTWLAETSLGIPAGLWIVLITGLGAQAASRRRQVAAASADTYIVPVADAPRFTAPVSIPAATTAPVTFPTVTTTPAASPVAAPAPASKPESNPAPVTASEPATPTQTAAAKPAPKRAASLRPTWPTDPFRRCGLTILSNTARTFESVGGAQGGLAESIARRLDERGSATRPLRVGMMLDDHLAERLADGSLRDVEWLRTEGTSPSLAMSVQNLDAVVTRAGEDEPDSLVVRTREHAAREAGWFDWGSPRPMTYFSIFPLRLDASRVTLPGLVRSLEQGETPALAVARRVIRLAALLSRSPSRVTLADRLSGRAAVVRGVRPDLIADALRESTELLSDPITPTERAAARVASAWIATENDALSDAERCRLADLAAHAAGDEPEVMLRVAAVRLSLLDEHLGIDALARADRMIRQRGTLGGLDHLKLLQAELEHGTYGDMTIGRVAAGVCLACAATPADRIAFLKDDLLEDFRFSHYLTGRDQDHAVLLEVFRELERNRRAESFGLPAAKAA
jgi:hypothetical protein